MRLIHLYNNYKNERCLCLTIDPRFFALSLAAFWTTVQFAPEMITILVIWYGCWSRAEAAEIRAIRESHERLRLEYEQIMTE